MNQAPPEPTDRRVVTHTFRVRYAETDAMGIAHHSSYVIWMEAGRTEFMRAFGFTYRQLEEMGVVMPVLEINVRYRFSAVYDDEIRVSTWVDELTRTRIKLAYSITLLPDDKLLAEGSSLHTFTNREGRPIRITHHPEAWSRLQSMAPLAND
jgi:acyl-CoA thioester hydrolase